MVIISTTLIYEEFHTRVQTRYSTLYRGRTLEELLLEIHQKRITLYYFCPTIGMAHAFLSIMERIYSADREIKMPTFDIPRNWVCRIATPESSSLNSGSSGDSGVPLASSVGNVSPVLTDVHSALELAVKEYLSTIVMKIPPNKRADAIKQHLESPAYSAEYKQCMIAMVKRLQQQAVSSTAPAPAPQPMQPTLSPAPPAHPPIVPNPRVASPIWIGRVAFRNGNSETFFDIATCPIPNPRDPNHPTLTPLPMDYKINHWPSVMVVSTFVSVQSPAVINSVPICRLVEIVPWSKESAAQNAEIFNGFRALLINRQLVGLVRLNNTQAMLIAARPNQLVGMVLTRQEAANRSENVFSNNTNTRNAASMERSATTGLSVSNDAFDSVDAITPDAILRQHRSTGTTSLPLLNNLDNNNHNRLDAFNSLLETRSADLNAAENTNIADNGTSLNPFYNTTSYLDTGDLVDSPIKRDNESPGSFFDY